jgi:hypothetical protein
LKVESEEKHSNGEVGGDSGRSVAKGDLKSGAQCLEMVECREWGLVVE